MFEKKWKDLSFHEKETDPKFALLVQLKMAEIEKDKQYWGKTSAIGLFKYVKIKALSPFQEKRDFFLKYLSYF